MFGTVMLHAIKTYYPWFPIVGLVVYLILFSTAAIGYPGGSINYPDAIGYSFFNNFLCDVMVGTTLAGIENNARTLAIISHWVLSFTMISFFYLLPEIFSVKNRNTFLTRFFGVLTMTIFSFMFTAYHDVIVTLTGIMGTIALIPFFIELRNYDHQGLKILAYLCFLLSIIVFIIFQTKIGFYYLPFLQKITFVFDAYWVVWVSYLVLKKNQRISNSVVSLNT
ncbi:MAG: hypothetical protein HKN76_15315 [Saprospiraceae bacterium]|nr:hypothetical protein [Saprospiraceae bacterium]